MIRVFARKTIASPIDDLAFFGEPPMWHIDDDVHVSCTFTYDKPWAEYLAEQWSSQGYKVTIGGPAYDDKGFNFVAGRYLREG